MSKVTRKVRMTTAPKPRRQPVAKVSLASVVAVAVVVAAAVRVATTPAVRPMAHPARPLLPRGTDLH